jgi:hypothetical protein
MWTYNYTHRLELYHYGVLGMKWGVRRTKEQLGYRRSAGAFGRGGKKLGKITEAEKADPSFWKSDISSLADLPRIKGSHTLEEDAAAVNPDFKRGIPYQINCTFCTATLEMRRRGFDVEALPIPERMALGDWEKMFKGAKFSDHYYSPKKYKQMTTAFDDEELAELGYTPAGYASEVSSKIAEWGEGARGTVYVGLAGYDRAHVFSVEIRGGKEKYIDPQNPGQNVERLLRKALAVRYLRTDNLEPSDEILRAVKKRGAV